LFLLPVVTFAMSQKEIGEMKENASAFLIKTKYSQQDESVIAKFMSDARKSNDDTCVMLAYNAQFVYYIRTHHDDKVDALLRQLYREKISDGLKAVTELYTAYTYRISGDPMKAIKLCQKIINTSKSKVEISNASFNIAILYMECRLKDAAVEKFKELCRFSETITDKNNYHYNLALYNGQLAAILLDQNQTKEAFLYIQKADSITKTDQEKSPSVLLVSHDDIDYLYGLYYLYQNDSRNFWRRVNGLKDAQPENVQYLRNGLLYRYYLKKKDYVKAKAYMIKYNESLNSVGRNDFEIDRLSAMADIEFHLGNMDEAAKYYQRFIATSDSINNLAMKLKTYEYSAQLDLDKANLEKSEFQAKANHYKLQIMMIIAIVTVITVILAVLFIVYLRKMNTQLRHLYAELQESYERVKAINRLKVAMGSNMSREIREPLSGIEGFAQIISTMGQNGSELEEYSRIINENSNQINKILDDVESSSDVEMHDVDREPVNVNECCEHVIATYKNIVPPSVSFIYKPSDKDLTFSSNNKWLIRILDNLIGNARKFTTEGSITLSYTIDASQLHIVVEDTGCGIPADKAEWVFEPFTKVNKFVMGTGLGLYVCRMIALKSGGSISIDTTYHNGCKVDVLLPL
jgi:signal transduction histidine kinase